MPIAPAAFGARFKNKKLVAGVRHSGMPGNSWTAAQRPAKQATTLTSWLTGGTKPPGVKQPAPEVPPSLAELPARSWQCSLVKCPRVCPRCAGHACAH